MGEIVRYLLEMGHGLTKVLGAPVRGLHRGGENVETKDDKLQKTV